MTFPLESRLWATSLLCVVSCVVLGYVVAGAASLWRIDAEAAMLRGSATGLATLLTLSGRALPLLFIAALGIAATVAIRSGWKIAVAIFATQLLSQGVVELIKRLFLRSRPDAWLVHQELGFSYPSGHATTAVVFYCSWAVLVWLLPLRTELKLALMTLLVVWAIGIDWSRMALGAHYPTDIFGGTLFGIASACAMWAIVLRAGLATPLH